MKTIIVWFRNDLRVHDHPALYAASKADIVIPVFIIDATPYNGKHASANRNRFLLECLNDLKRSLQEIGGNLVVRSGEPDNELHKLAQQYNADAVYYTKDFSPYAISRDEAVKESLEAHNVLFRGFAGRLAVDNFQDIHTQAGNPHKVFTPFWKNWMGTERRPVAPQPGRIAIPTNIFIGEIPSSSSLNRNRLSPHVIRGGETIGRKRLYDFLDSSVDDYHIKNDQMGTEGTSRLSPYLHFGCISVREIETMLSDSKGAAAWHRQLCWRDFYHYILFHFPNNSHQEFQERYRALDWNHDTDRLQAWQDGQTGYPVVDAAMRQLKQEGWMHNRARLIVGSFLTKDLGLDWRFGEQHFMEWLLDGDQANNNGNWQWIASVGVDPAPVFRRLYNPILQQERYDANGSYVRKYVPELRSIPGKYLANPWEMHEEEQHNCQCIIGKDYPLPIVDHAEARSTALERYRKCSL